MTPHGSFLSSLKQGFGQDVEREVVRGHFDVNSPSGTQRYYCLVNPKTGKAEENGVSGQPVPRRDGMTGIKGAAVTFYRCAEAEQKGLLVTSGYLVGAAGGAVKGAAAPTPDKEAKGSQQSPAPGAPPAPADVLAAFAHFVGGQNAHDREAVSQLLLNSRDFVWEDYTGRSIWGYQEALDAFEQAWRDGSKLEPQMQDARVAELSPSVAVLVTPLQLTAGSAGASSPAVSLRWSGVFVKTKTGWRLASIFTSPLAN